MNVLIGQKRLNQADALSWRHCLSRAVDGSDGDVDRTGRIVSCHSRRPHHFIFKKHTKESRVSNF